MAYSKRGVITQGGADTFGLATIDTNLTADGKSGWEIVAFSGYWSTGETVASVDSEFNAILAVQPTITTFDQDEEIHRLNWATANTAGVAVGWPLRLVQREFLIEPRITVQPLIYVQAASVATAVANILYYEIHYNIVKLSDIEVLRLLQGGI